MSNSENLSPVLTLTGFKLPWLKCFVTLVRTGRLQSTAEQLGLSEQSVRNYLQALENYLQSPLLEIQHNQIRLIGKGQDFYLRARQILEKIDFAQAEQQAIKTTWPRLKLGGHVNICPELIGTCLQEVQKSATIYPEIHLISGVNALKRVEEALNNRVIDLGIAIAQPQHPLIDYCPGPLLKLIPVQKSGTHPKAYALRPSLCDARFRYPVQLRSQLDHLNLLLCAQGELASVFSENQVSHLLAAGHLEHADPAPEHFKIQLYLLWRNEGLQTLPQITQHFVKVLKQHCRSINA